MIFLIEKAKLQVATSDWEQALETCVRLDEPEPSVDSIKINLLWMLTRGGNSANSGNAGKFGNASGGSLADEVVGKLDSLFQLLQQREPYNGKMLLDAVQLFSSLAGRNKKVLKCTQLAIQNFVDGSFIRGQKKESAKFLTELGYQYLLLHDTLKAAHYFQEASQRDGDDGRALYGLIH